MKCLEDTRILIIDVASEVGFESPSYFIKTFKALKQMTPTEYRKMVTVRDASSSDIPKEFAK